MKILTTLTAVAALVLGMSIAAAQTPTTNKMQTQDKASGTQMDLNTSAGANAKSGKTASPGPKTIGMAAFCINTSANGALNCKYASMAACEKDAKPQNLNCSPNPNMGTTGAK